VSDIADDIIVVVIGGAVIFYLITINHAKKNHPINKLKTKQHKHHPAAHLLKSHPHHGRAPDTHSNQHITGSATFIYKRVGQVLPGSAFASYGTSSRHALNSGGRRPSTRFVYGSGKVGCVPFFNKEFTAYVHVGTVYDHRQRLILTSGGGPQAHDRPNCCVYSVGFTMGGAPWVEEEGPHNNGGIHITPNLYGHTNKGPHLSSIGSLHNRTIGIKHVNYIDKHGNSILEGFVDKNANGHWTLYYRGVNVSGHFRQGGHAPVITHAGLTGSKCQEARIRGDGAWPVTLNKHLTSIAHIEPI
jgi:hypothetical protein